MLVNVEVYNLAIFTAHRGHFLCECGFLKDIKKQNDFVKLNNKYSY